MMTKTEIAKLVALDGKCGYHDANKAEFKRLSMKLLRALAANVGGKVSYNAAGIACSGDATLHSELTLIGRQRSRSDARKRQSLPTRRPATSPARA